MHCGIYEMSLLKRALMGQYHTHNAPIPYPTMHQFVTEMCTNVHISVTKWCIMGFLFDALWDLWDGYINLSTRSPPTSCSRSGQLTERHVPLSSHWILSSKPTSWHPSGLTSRLTLEAQSFICEYYCFGINNLGWYVAKIKLTRFVCSNWVRHGYYIIRDGITRN